MQTTLSQGSACSSLTVWKNLLMSIKAIGFGTENVSQMCLFELWRAGVVCVKCVQLCLCNACAARRSSHRRTPPAVTRLQQHTPTRNWGCTGLVAGQHVLFHTAAQPHTHPCCQCILLPMSLRAAFRSTPMLGIKGVGAHKGCKAMLGNPHLRFQTSSDALQMHSPSPGQRPV